MKLATKIFLLATAIAVSVVPAWAGAPVPGTYKAQDGDILEARYTESFAGAGQYLTIGNAFNASSWSGAALGTQWWVSCPAIDAAPVLIVDTVNILGSGIQIWQKTFSGATFYMNGTGEAWDGGDASYTGTVDTFSESVTILFSSFVRVSATSNVSWTGTFDGYPLSCITVTQNGADLMGAKPANYPDYVSPVTCSADRSFGRFGNATDMTFAIGPCAVPTEESTWGRIKELYR